MGIAHDCTIARTSMKINVISSAAVLSSILAMAVSLPIDLSVGEKTSLVGTVSDGWCKNLGCAEAHSHHSLSWCDGGMPYGAGGNPSTQEECFAYCDEKPGCSGAVFESEGPWGTQCWVGTSLQAAAGTGWHRGDVWDRSGPVHQWKRMHATTDHCYLKPTYGDLSVKVISRGKSRCRGEPAGGRWDQPVYGNPDTEQDCAQRCHDAADCNYAVYLEVGKACHGYDTCELIHMWDTWHEDETFM